MIKALRAPDWLQEVRSPKKKRSMQSQQGGSSPACPKMKAGASRALSLSWA